MIVAAEQLDAGFSSRPHFWFPIACSALAWVVIFMAIPPAQQDFPLDDDWAFAHGAFDFAQSGEIHYQGWASIPELGQWLWAWPFVRIFGEHHQVLRVSTILLSWIGLAALGDLLRQSGLRPWWAAVTATALALNPLFFLLQGTFMTDVPSLSFALLALALYHRGLITGRRLILAGAAVAGLLGALTRQNTLAAPLAAGMMWLLAPRSRRSWAAALAILVPLAAGLGIHFWFQARADVFVFKMLLLGPLDLLFRLFVIVHLLGLCALPVLALVGGGIRGRWFWCALAVLIIAAASCWRLSGELPFGPLFPYSGNLLTPWGALAGALVPGPLVMGHRPLLLGEWARLALTGLGCLAGALLIARFRGADGGRWRHPLVLFSLANVLLILIAGSFFDRYALPLLPGALFLLARSQRASRLGWLVSGVLLVVTAIVSVGLMHDWLAWNAARWTLGRRAVAHRIPARAIEGGLEWDGWYAPLPLHAQPPRPRHGLELAFSVPLFDHLSGQYALSFSPLPEYPAVSTLDAEPYRLWLQPGAHRFLLLYWPAGGT